MEKQYIVYKFRLYPTKEQKKLMDQSIGCSRYMYNWALEQRNKAYEAKEPFPSNYDLANNIKYLKKDEKTSWLKEADSNALQIAIQNNGAAFKNFFKHNAKHPVKRKKRSSGSYETQLQHKYYANINDGIIVLPKMGEVKIITHRHVDINSVKDYVTISRNTIGEYYISIKALIDAVSEPTLNPTIENTIGVDLGVRGLAILDDGTKFSHFSIDKKVLKRKKRLQRKLSKKIGSKKGEKKSNNYKKLQQKIAKIDLTIARKREKYQYDVIKSITNKKCDYIAMEDLNVKGMEKNGGNKKKCINRGIANAAMGVFKIKMTNKAASKGKKVVEVDRWYPSSKICHKCGHIYRELKLSQRNWICPACGTELDRDKNAAINIRNKSVADNERYLPKCKGEVKSVESENKQNKKKQSVYSTSAFCESENTFKNNCDSVVYQQIT